MNDFTEQLRNLAARTRGHVVFPESEDERVLRAAIYLVNQSICRVTLLGVDHAIERSASALGLVLPDSIQAIEPNPDLYLERYMERRAHKNLDREEALRDLNTPLYYAMAMCAWEDADGCVCGAVTPTAKVLQAVLRVVGLRKGIETVSSIFLMVLPDRSVLTYGDCGVVPYPDSQQLADITLASAQSHARLTGDKPIVAMLSFSTGGSAKHERVELVKTALNLVKQRNPELTVDGELQFDAAYDADVARRKAPGSPVAGNANVYIFPNLDAGNIAYKITERIGGATAIGPILQGLNRPVVDLSRGCAWQDVVNAACAAILMSGS